MDAEVYLAALKAKLVNSAIIKQIHVVEEYVTREQGYFRARLTLQNGDFVEVAEFFRVWLGDVQTVEYRHQWMDPNREHLRRRWDNATHFPGLTNFPHHVHIGRTGAVEPGQPLSITDLVDLIEQELAA